MLKVFNPVQNLSCWPLGDAAQWQELGELDLCYRPFWVLPRKARERESPVRIPAGKPGLVQVYCGSLSYFRGTGEHACRPLFWALVRIKIAAIVVFRNRRREREVSFFAICFYISHTVLMMFWCILNYDTGEAVDVRRS